MQLRNQHFRRRAIVLGGALVIAGACAYSNSLYGPFIFDDATGIVDNQSIRSLWSWNVFAPPSNTTVAVRPILNLSFAINFFFGGLRVEGYHLTNIAIHLAAGLLLFGIVRRTLLLPGYREKYGGAADWLAFWAALLWTVHPLQTESVTYVVQRAESLAGFFFLGIFYCFVRGAAGGSKVWFAAAVLACVLGLGTKEYVGVAPFLALLFDRCFLSGSFKQALRERGVIHMALLASLAILAVLIINEPRSFILGHSMRLTPLRYGLTQFGVIIHYLHRAVVPLGLSLDYGWEYPQSLGAILLPGVIILMLLVLTLWALRYAPAAGFLGVWFFLILAPTSSIIPFVDAAVEHRMYLPLAAVTVFLAIGLHRVALLVRHRSEVIGGALNVFVVMILLFASSIFGRLTWSRNQDYQLATRIWQDTIEKSPNNSRAYLSLGHVLHEQGDDVVAEREMRRSLAVTPDYPQARHYLSAFLSERGRHEEALQHAVVAVKVVPLEPEYHFNYGRVLDALGQTSRAEAAYQQTLSLNPDHAGAWYNVGNMALRSKDAPLAIDRYSRAIDIRPDYVDARVNLANALNQLGRTDAAIAALAEAARIAVERAEAARRSDLWAEAAELQCKVVQIRPDDLEARLQLARDLMAAGRPEAAAEQCRLVLERSPSNAEARSLLNEITANESRRP
ncbi:MAG TPA: tetratricopeptide repeat protein [Phycisphaerae bacterium]|nr:tetratricopeptide repeat protein [Phycisphaerae bacterium]